MDYQDAMATDKNFNRSCVVFRKSTERELQNALDFLDSFPEIERTITDIEWL